MVFPVFFDTESRKIQGPELTAELKYVQKDEQRMRTKIRALLHGAVMAKCQACVFSAFGCGAFGNPPEEVARVFKEEMCKVDLKWVTFCILNDHNAHRRHNPRGNFRPFQETFQNWKMWNNWRDCKYFALKRFEDSQCAPLQQQTRWKI